MASNNTSKSNESESCQYQPVQVMILSLNDIAILLIGPPVLAKLLWVILTSKKAIDILNFNLALFHNAQYLISILHVFALYLLPNDNQNILRFLLIFVQTGGPMCLSLICLERFVAVIHPTSYPLLKKYRCRELGAVTVWLSSMPAALASVWGPNSPSDTTEDVLSSLPFCVMLVMVAMMALCSNRIARELKKCGPGRGLLHPGKRRALLTVRATSVITMLCYLPVAYLQFYQYRDEKMFDCIITPICVFLLTAASVVHPLLYLSTQGKLFFCSE